MRIYAILLENYQPTTMKAESPHAAMLAFCAKYGFSVKGPSDPHHLIKVEEKGPLDVMHYRIHKAGCNAKVYEVTP